MPSLPATLIPFVDALACLKKELDAILALQAKLDTINEAIEEARATFTQLDHTSDCRKALESLERTHEHLKDKFEALYASLHVPEGFPELENIDFKFIRILLLARDLKINIRKRAIGGFIEWDRLDQAVGSRSTALG